VPDEHLLFFLREVELGCGDVAGIDGERPYPRRVRDEALVPRRLGGVEDLEGEAEPPRRDLREGAGAAEALAAFEREAEGRARRRAASHLRVDVPQPDGEVGQRSAVDDEARLSLLVLK